MSMHPSGSFTLEVDKFPIWLLSGGVLSATTIDSGRSTWHNRPMNAIYVHHLWGGPSKVTIVQKLNLSSKARDFWRGFSPLFESRGGGTNDIFLQENGLPIGGKQQIANVFNDFLSAWQMTFIFTYILCTATAIQHADVPLFLGAEHTTTQAK